MISRPKIKRVNIKKNVESNINNVISNVNEVEIVNPNINKCSCYLN